MDHLKPPRTRNTHIRKWNEAIKDWNDQIKPSDGYPPQHPAFLWKVCWEQLNVMKIPILSAEYFFEEAIKTAKDENVTNSEEFMRHFKENVERLQAVWEQSFRQVDHELSRKACSGRDEWESIYRVLDDRSYMDFLQLLRGAMGGWRPDSKFMNDSTFNPRDTVKFKLDRYYGYNGHDYDSDGCIEHDYLSKAYNARDYGADDCSCKTCQQNRGQTQRKRKKNGSPDDNKQRSKRQKLERSTADSSPSYTSSPSTKHVQGETAAKTSNNQMSESHTADSLLFQASPSSTEPIEEERPVKRFKRQRQQPPTIDSQISFTASSGDTEERPAKRVKREMPECDTAGSSLPHASSPHTERVKRERPAKRAKRQMPESDAAGSVSPHASSSRTKYIEEESSTMGFERQRQEFATADSSLSPISSSSARNAQRPAKRSRRQMSQSHTTKSSTTRTLRRNKGSALWELNCNGKAIEI